MRVLVLNAGSSSLKASVIENAQRAPLATASVAWGSDATRVAHRAETVERALEELAAAGIERTTIAAVGHRFVHGGAFFREPTLLNEKVVADLGRLVHLAPLHNGVALDTIVAAHELLPHAPHVCVFDTGFHATLPSDAAIYPLPWHWYEEWGIRRFGFHGLSVAWAVRRAGEMMHRRADRLCIVVAHLGSGCSVTAVQDGRSVATSMGLTPLEGLMMGTRAGSFDPGVLIGLLREERLTLEELAEAVDHESGLLGISGVGGDVREVSRAAESGNRRASLALAMFVRRAAEGIAAAATSLRRLDVLVFTGGIGENAATLRTEIAQRLAVVGVPAIAAVESGEDRLLSPAGDAPVVLRVEAREDLVIGEAVTALLAAADQGAVLPPST